MAKVEQIILPSFLRRVLKAYALKAQIRSQGCELNRIGRSRNWRLKATPEQISSVIHLIEEANEDSWLWLAKHLTSYRQALTHQTLFEMAKKRNLTTVNELMALTDCTVAQARKVLDEIEWGS
ncbi:hypothetical protein GCM10011501_13180 [Thalassotalea profundi]|uniref:Ribosome recycling factor n=2 Tax=Thalassotalea profundi TaxID=2036687 RepID=A0ABQ3IIL1_9GAMM|nr:hypothetical protein GCM10011501_13180 [Thalassotalea profundi]